MLEDSYDAWETGEEITTVKSSIREWESRNEGEKKEEMSRMYSQASLDAFSTQGRLKKKRILPAWMQPNEENNHLIRHTSHTTKTPHHKLQCPPSHVQEHQPILDIPHVPHGQEQPQPHPQDVLDVQYTHPGPDAAHEHPPNPDAGHDHPDHPEPLNQDLPTEMSRPGKCNEQPESVPEQSLPALMRVLGEQPCPEQQSPTEQCTPHIRQSSTIPLAVLRYDTVPANNFLMHKLIHNIIHPGDCPSLSQQHGPKHHRLLDKLQEHGQHPHHAQQNVAAPTPSPDQYKLSENKPNPGPDAAHEHPPNPDASHDHPDHPDPLNQDLPTEMSRPGKCNEQPESVPEQSSPALM